MLGVMPFVAVILILPSAQSTQTVEIAPGVFYPIVQLGACTDCKTKQVCCGSNLSASVPAWIQAIADSDIMPIDTQLRYNDTELVHQVLQKAGRSRQQLWITTKIDPKAFCTASDPKATALKLVQENLQQLNMSYVDLLLLHEPCDRSGKPHPADQMAWEALQEAVQKGWARAIGVDKFKPAQIDALQGAKPAVLMASMSMSSHDDETIEYCQKNGIQYNAFGVMHGCKFTDPTVQSLATKYNASTAQICGVWTRQRGCTMAMGVGSDPLPMAAYIREDLDIFKFNMTETEVTALNQLQNSD
jgi:diketogulonate reductase-like aldo/keto reductase